MSDASNDVDVGIAMRPRRLAMLRRFSDAEVDVAEVVTATPVGLMMSMVKIESATLIRMMMA